MAIPQEIKAVKRPVNTVVYAYGKNHDRYLVKKRIGCKRVNGRNIPVNGPTIGHIIDGVYVSIEDSELQRLSKSSIDLKDWGNAVLCDRLFMDILDELKAVYVAEDAVRICCIAILRVCNPGIKDYELQEAYSTSFLSELYPGVSLSRNSVCSFLDILGKNCSRIITFMRNRTAALGIGHLLLVDGTLKSDESNVNSLSSFSRKARIKGTRDISVLYAFDLEKMEPVCSECFPGNMLDQTSYEAFIRDNGIHKGIIVGDKGFPAAAAQEQFSANPDLHYMNPIKRNSKVIETHHLLEYDGVLKGYEGIQYRKAKCSGKEKWFYSFRDSHRAAKEEQDYLRREKDTYSETEFRKKQQVFGTVILECDLDMAAEEAYKAYACRWNIEIVMRFYKSACEFDETRVHSDYSVISSEFCDFLSSLLTFRLLNEFDRLNLLEKRTYKSLMSVLYRAKKLKMNQSDWQLIRMNPSQIEILQKLDLLPAPPEKPKRKRGRPRKMAI